MGDLLSPRGPRTCSPRDYAPEEYVSPLLEPSVATYNMQLIGILQCMCEYGQVNICIKVSMQSSSLRCCMRDTWKQYCMCSPSQTQNETQGSSLTQRSPMWKNLILWSVTGLTSMKVHRTQFCPPSSNL